MGVARVVRVLMHLTAMAALVIRVLRLPDRWFGPMMDVRRAHRIAASL